MLRDPLIAAVRTGCAAIVTLALAYGATKLGVTFPDGTSEALQGAALVVAVAVVNLAVNALERVHPLFGVLLGVPKAPAYPASTPNGDEGTTIPDVVLIVIGVCVVILTLAALGVNLG